jgi:hypothetical protein
VLARFLRLKLDKMTKKKSPKNKNELKIYRKKKNLPMRGISVPESFLFGLFISSALLFSFLSWQSANQISTSFSTADTSRGNQVFQKKINKLVDGYPIKKMTPYISHKNKKVASFLVAIAKKESNWGKHSPKKNGKECFNYWGYRGPENPTASGYSCFDSPQHAVNVVGGRIGKLVDDKIDTPKKMVMWKCGSTSCARSDRGAAKWIWDVGYYYKKVFPSAKKDNKDKEITMLR